MSGRAGEKAVDWLPSWRRSLQQRASTSINYHTSSVRGPQPAVHQPSNVACGKAARRLYFGIQLHYMLRVVLPPESGIGRVGRSNRPLDYGLCAHNGSVRQQRHFNGSVC